MIHTALKDRLLQPDMLALPDDEYRLAILVNTKDIELDVPIPLSILKRYLKLKKLWVPVKSSSADSAITAFDTITDKAETELDMQDSDVKSFVELLLIDLVTDVVEFTDTHRLEILSLGKSYVSWAESNHYNPLRVGYLNKARLG